MFQPILYSSKQKYSTAPVLQIYLFGPYHQVPYSLADVGHALHNKTCFSGNESFFVKRLVGPNKTVLKKSPSSCKVTMLTAQHDVTKNFHDTLLVNYIHTHHNMTLIGKKLQSPTARLSKSFSGKMPKSWGRVRLR